MIEVITKAKLLEEITSNKSLVLLDVRDTPDYEKAHIVGAKHMLIADMNSERIHAEFNPDDNIVTYSQDRQCPAKTIAAKKLLNMGFKQVRAYEGSWQEWNEAGYPIES